jgi:hypothetical protein
MPSIGDTTRPEYIYDQATDTWIPVGIGPHAHTPAAIGAIASSVVTTKGDIIAATGSGVVVRQGVGVDGSMLVADSSQADGLNYALGNAFAAGKNKIINGDFSIWQRGTTFSSGFTADRWVTSADVGITFSQQTFTPGTAPVAGYEGTYFGRFVKSSGGTYGIGSYQKIEDVRVLAGQTVTLSFWAKADSAIAITPYYNQVFGTGGSGTVGNAIGTVTLTTSWARYSLTFSMPSMSGKTIGTNSFTEIYVTRYIGSAAVTIDLWGVQLEAGSVATPFQTATGTIQGELAACMRYYQRWNTANAYIYGEIFPSWFIAQGTTGIGTYVNLPIAMRAAPVPDYTSIAVFNLTGSIVTTNPSLTRSSATMVSGNCVAVNLAVAVSSGTPFTIGSFYAVSANNNASGFVALTAEL